MAEAVAPERHRVHAEGIHSASSCKGAEDGKLLQHGVPISRCKGGVARYVAANCLYVASCALALRVMTRARTLATPLGLKRGRIFQSRNMHPLFTLYCTVYCVLSVQTSICLRTDPNWYPPKPAVKLFVNDDIQTSQA